jgi:hypothetical protein
VLLHVASVRPRARVRHVYLRDAATLRPDLTRASAAPHAGAPLLDALEARLAGGGAGGRP